MQNFVQDGRNIKSAHRAGLQVFFAVCCSIFGVVGESQRAMYLVCELAVVAVIKGWIRCLCLVLVSTFAVLKFIWSSNSFIERLDIISCDIRRGFWKKRVFWEAFITVP